jgi:hypothetical protein
VGQRQHNRSAKILMLAVRGRPCRRGRSIGGSLGFPDRLIDLAQNMAHALDAQREDEIF